MELLRRSRRAIAPRCLVVLGLGIASASACRPAPPRTGAAPGEWTTLVIVVRDDHLPARSCPGPDRRVAAALDGRAIGAVVFRCTTEIRAPSRSLRMTVEVPPGRHRITIDDLTRSATREYRFPTVVTAEAEPGARPIRMLATQIEATVGPTGVELGPLISPLTKQL